MRRSLWIAVAAAALGLAATPAVAAPDKPTIVLVHGAFADGSSWNGVVADLQRDGYTVIAPANPLRGIISDGAYVASVVKSVKGPVVLVGHSYGGAVISQAGAAPGNVKSLVYVDAFTLDVGETIGELGPKFPAIPLGAALTAVPLPDGGQDLYVRPDQFGVVFAPDVPPKAAKLAAAEQRPISAQRLRRKAHRGRVADHPRLVHLRLGGPGHCPGRARLLRRPRPLAENRRGARRLARHFDLAPARGLRPDRGRRQRALDQVEITLNRRARPCTHPLR